MAPGHRCVVDPQSRVRIPADDVLAFHELNLARLEHQTETRAGSPSTLFLPGTNRPIGRRPNRRLPAVALAPDRADESLSIGAEGLAQLRDLEAQRVVRDRHVRPDLLDDLLMGQKTPGVVEKVQQELPTLVLQRDLLTVLEQNAPDGVVQEGSEPVSHIVVGCSRPILSRLRTLAVLPGCPRPSTRKGTAAPEGAGLLLAGRVGGSELTPFTSKSRTNMTPLNAENRSGGVFSQGLLFGGESAGKTAGPPRRRGRGDRMRVARTSTSPGRRVVWQPQEVAELVRRHVAGDVGQRQRRSVCAAEDDDAAKPAASRDGEGHQVGVRQDHGELSGALLDPTAKAPHAPPIRDGPAQVSEDLVRNRAFDHLERTQPRSRARAVELGVPEGDGFTHRRDPRVGRTADYGDRSRGRAAHCPGAHTKAQREQRSGKTPNDHERVTARVLLAIPTSCGTCGMAGNAGEPIIRTGHALAGAGRCGGGVTR